MRDQASRLRDLTRQASNNIVKKQTAGPRIISITSGKGGVGKTNFVVNLAISLAESGYKTVIFDADLGLANAEVLMGFSPPYTLYDLLYNDKNIEDIVIKGPGGVQMVSGGSGFQELANLDGAQREKLIASMSYFQDKADFILVDTSAGISRNVLGFVAAADEVMLVITPEPTSLTDAYSLIKVLSKFSVHKEVQLVVNMALDEREALNTSKKLMMVTNRFLQIELKLLGYLLSDNSVVQAVKSQKPVVLSYPYSIAAKNFNNIAKYLSSGEKQPTKGMYGFIGKLLKLFG